MGMSIDDIKHCLKVMVDCEVCEECNLYGTTGTDHCEHDCVYGALDIIDKYQMFQTKYVERLKADMVAMLTEIQLEIEELDLKDFVPDYQKGADETREYIADLLQQKIDTLLEVCCVGSSQDWNGTH